MYFSIIFIESKALQPVKRFVMNNESPVAFTAGISPRSVDHLKHQDTIKFETVITDISGGYNNQSGVFVAPVSGIYMFSCSLMDDLEEHGLMLHAEIVQNQRVLGRIFAHAEANNHRDQGAQTVFTYINQGDKVWVRTIDNQNLGLGGELYSTFSGYLLLAM
ncbi:complement C1q-like protein 3 [Mercenaria mercenaria]|uniref:complement C1q-like protein 3 n=1 Tax=Mercenaria mercenaria TaxID=6596 RepID=UPI00234F3AAB|nr:complement C1q-like protein 3 [Mercenaria mercenaria]